MQVDGVVAVSADEALSVTTRRPRGIAEDGSVLGRPEQVAPGVIAGALGADVRVVGGEPDFIRTGCP